MVTTRSGRFRQWSAMTTWGSKPWQRCLAAFVTVVAFWPQVSLVAAPGIDPSWQAGLALARITRVRWGHDLVYNYGPLGFLQNSGYYSTGQSMLATLYQAAVVAGLFLGVAAALRLRYSPMTALLGAAAVTGIASIAEASLYTEIAVLAAVSWAGVLLLGQPSRRTMLIGCASLGALAGLHLLIKYSTGLHFIAIAITLSILLGWQHVERHVATVASCSAAFMLGWLAMGQSVGDLPGWLNDSNEIVSGYVEGLAIPIPWDAAGALLLTVGWAVALVAMFLRGAPRIPRSYTVFIAIVTAMAAKTAFARYDSSHFAYLLAVIVVAIAISALPQMLPRRTTIISATVAVLYTLAIAVVFSRSLAIVEAPARAAQRLATLAWPGLAQHYVTEGKATQRAFYRIPDSMIATIGTGTVHIDPSETSAAWAYDLAWRPVPIFQAFQAYSPRLDAMNAAVLATETQFVLSKRSTTSPATTIENRLLVQTSPLYYRAMLCNQKVREVDKRWALFARTADRCAPPTLLSEVDVSGGKSVTVPAPSDPDSALLVGIDLQPTLMDRLFDGHLVPLTEFRIVLDGISYRLTNANAAEPFLLNTPASTDGTNLEIRSRTIGISRMRSLGQSEPSARLRFYEVHVAP